MTESLLALAEVRAGSGLSRVLHGVSFETRAGEVVSQLGRNGAGKSTTLKSIMGLIRAPRSPAGRAPARPVSSPPVSEERIAKAPTRGGESDAPGAYAGAARPGLTAPPVRARRVVVRAASDPDS